jgi:polar amino acid transport system substrate-binding protein
MCSARLFRSRTLPFLAGLLAVALLSCTPAGNSPGTTRPSAYDRVLETKTLRVAYITYPPSFLKDASTGAFSGIMHDALEDIAKRLELKVDYVSETAWGSMIEEVRSGRADLVCTGLWPNATRGKFVDFTDPVYFSPIKAYVKAGNRAFDGNLKAINSPTVRIATVDGEMTSIIAAADYPLAKVESHPQSTAIAQMLMEVATGKADVTFVEPAVAAGFLENNRGAVEPVGGTEPVRVFPNVMMVAKNEPRLLSMLNIALSEAENAGVLDRIVEKYEASPGLFFRRLRSYRLP